MKFVDLSVDLNEKTPVYPGDPSFSYTQAGVLEKDGYSDGLLSFGNHNGTHIDAPRHMLSGGKSLHEYPVDHFIGRGVVIKCGKEITLEKVQAVPIQEGDIVLFNTGMANEYFEKSYYDNYPILNEEIANYLVSKKVKMVGVDTCSVDGQVFPVHKILLRNDVLIIENLTGLDALEGEKFTVYALPLKLEIDGSPARVIAQIL